VLGDSHGVELSYALGELLRAENKSVLQLTYSGCPPALTFETYDPAYSKWLKNAIPYIQDLDSPRALILVFHHTSYLERANPYIKGNGPESAAVTYWNGFGALLKQLPDYLQIYIVSPVPELPGHIRKIILPSSISSDSTTRAFSYPLAGEITRALSVDTMLKNLAIPYKAEVIEPRKKICADDTCKAVIDKKALYFDQNHPSLFGASLIAQQIKMRLTNKLLKVEQTRTLDTASEE
jgi:hypothetical protein